MLTRFAILPFVLIIACHSGEGGGGGWHSGPVPAKTEKLQARTIFDADDYLASMTSRRSVTIFPQVTGYIRAIHVKPGDAVKAGTLLVEIDPGQQKALLQSLAAGLQSRKAALSFAVENDKSAESLKAAGYIGSLDAEQRHSARLGAESDVKAGEAQLEAQSALLRFYNLAAPIDGVVGDVPVKVGDYVDPSVKLSSIDQSESVEAYVYVPVAKARVVTKDTLIQIIDGGGEKLCEQKPTFISPQVSVETQTVLVKTVCPNEHGLRSAQVVKARVVWGKREGVLIPVHAITRSSGQYFAYVVEQGKAKQRPIEVGAMEGNDFVVTKGLEAGTEIVVSNIQKMHDGAELAPPEPAAKTNPEH
jgi:RND family efflux transporter MFP subunit